MTPKRRTRPFGRPLLGDEPLNERVAVPISASMKAKLEVKAAGGSVADVIRKILERYFASSGRPAKSRSRVAPGKGRPRTGRGVRGKGRGKSRGVRRFSKGGA